MIKLVKESLEENVENYDSIPIYRIRMVKDIEFTPEELEEYKRVNSLDDSDLKKLYTGLAKVKWRNLINNAIENKTPEDIKKISDT
ncbi:MAG: hypothetical protein RSE41_04155, partial [Clostridia bacterium]